jgi:hypothetical protein
LVTFAIDINFHSLLQIHTDTSKRAKGINPPCLEYYRDRCYILGATLVRAGGLAGASNRMLTHRCHAGNQHLRYEGMSPNTAWRMEYHEYRRIIGDSLSRLHHHMHLLAISNDWWYPRPRPTQLPGPAHRLDEKVKVGDPYFNNAKQRFRFCYASHANNTMTKEWSIRWNHTSVNTIHTNFGCFCYVCKYKWYSPYQVEMLLIYVVLHFPAATASSS